ncbi:MAG: hypothetical protein JSS82_16705 [Bacteroidetes bacterium]|nr:hypothetical protein [Bacteroidota bacterium]
MLHPYTYQQAQEIAEDFEDIIDTEQSRGGVKMVVDSILIRPYDEASRDLPLEDYYNSEYVEIEDEQRPDAKYVVLVVMTAIDGGDVLVLDIADYVAANGINYNFP